jgi:mono/diheme cytochrome c family protein/glucose/arabinose dehydrogenase
MKSRLLYGFHLLAASCALTPAGAQQPTAAEGSTNVAATPAADASPGLPGKKKRQGGGPEDPERPFRPPAPPVLSPEEALKTFKLPPGFKIQTVAAEPLVETPVAVTWDARGRMYVVEMRGYMPDMDATGEDQPVGRIKLLEDTNGDGVYDKAAVFIDHLVMPRAVIATGDGVLVVTPPNLTFHRDTNHDGVADTSELVDDKVGTLGGQPEYLPNSPLYALDNWITFSLHTLKYQYQQGVFTSALAGKSGQWGRSQDDWGRQFFNYNSDLLRTDLVPPLWYNRNPRLGERTAINVQVIKDQTVWPGHPNPGINRGYAPKGLREDGTQAATTATCGPGIYRGDLFPADFQGNAFVPEPAGNLVKRLKLKDQAGSVSAENAYKDHEFLTSTDERFRPVNALTGPDGALYIVDMARGVIQHKVFLSYYLAANIEERKLEQPINLGRIYRIVPDGSNPKAVQLPEAPSELVPLLSHKNGWVRDNAQRLIVESGDLSVTPALEKLFRTGKTRQSRIHALWTLEGLHALTRETVQAALKDKEPKVRAAGIRLLTDATWQHALLPASQPQGEQPSAPPSNQASGQPLPSASAAADLGALLNDRDPEVQMLAAFQLAAVNTAEVRRKLTTLLKTSGSPLVAQGIASGIAGNELAYLQELLALPASDSKWLLASGILKTLAACVMNERNPAKVGALIEAAAALPANGSLRPAVLEGMAGKAPDKTKKSKPGSGPRPVNLPAEPPALATLSASAKPATLELLERINRQLGWPGKPLPEGVKPPPPPLNADERQQFAKGKELYGTVCIACHQPNGAGLPGLAPTLVNSEWVNGPATRAIRIILQGLTGPIEVAGTSWQMEMPAVTMFNDEQVAAILTYIRREWDNDGSAVAPGDVSKVRAAIAGRTSAWTAKELADIR